MERIATLDTAIRIMAAVTACTLGLAMLILVSAMATDTGTTKALVGALSLFLIGAAVLGCIVLLSLFPNKIEKFIPGPTWLGVVIVRVPIYPISIVGTFLLIRQIVQVAIPDLLVL